MLSIVLIVRLSSMCGRCSLIRMVCVIVLFWLVRIVSMCCGESVIGLSSSEYVVVFSSRMISVGIS